MRGRGAAERGRGRAQRPSVGVVGWPPESSAGFRGARPQDRSHGSVVRNGAVTFANGSASPPGVRAVDRTRGRDGESSGGAKPRRAPARSAVGFFGRKLEGIRGRSRERTPGGSKASKRAKRPRAGEPEGLLCRSSGRRAGQLARWTDGLHDRGETTFPSSVSRTRVLFTGGCERG